MTVAQNLIWRTLADFAAWYSRLESKQYNDSERDQS